MVGEKHGYNFVVVVKEVRWCKVVRIGLVEVVESFEKFLGGKVTLEQQGGLLSLFESPCVLSCRSRGNQQVKKGLKRVVKLANRYLKLFK